ncbi:MAG TPA: carboxypeptidase-like regulatory domain-containing protein [Gemmatimonadales bacterium]|jgi:hypothetical protein
MIVRQWLNAAFAIAAIGPGVVRTLPAQVGVTTDIITGIVVDANGAPLAGVAIQARSLETEVVRTAVTDERGRYIILFPDGGGQYEVTARLVGMLPQTATLVRYADEDRLLWDVRLQATAFALDPVVVTGERQPVRSPQGPNPGDQQRTLTPDALARLPLDVDDLALLAALVPGAIVIDATDSTAATYSVAGQRPDANETTLDGMSFGSGQLPQEGLRSTQVVSSTYDIARGRFSGGLMASTSRSGSNNAQGSLNYSLRDQSLAFGGGEDTPFTSGFSQHVVGGGVGGPLIRNRLLVYVSGNARLRGDPLTALTTATPADLDRVGVAHDSVDRFLDIVDGFGLTTGTPAPDGRDNTTLSTLARLDYLVSNAHTLTLRGDWRGTVQEPTRLPTTALPETSGESTNRGGGLMMNLASRFGMRVVNEFKAYGSTSTQAGEPYLSVPQGRVVVASSLEDGSTGFTTLILGGNASLPSSSRVRALDLSDEVSLLPGALRHRIKLGGAFRVQGIRQSDPANQFGIFTYNSLRDLETGTPASFTRTLEAPARNTTVYDWAVYAGDVWIPSRWLQLTIGLRAEGSTFGSPPPANPALASALGVRTDRLPSEVDLSPRVGFTWTVGGGLGAPPTVVFRGGAGRFRSPIPTGLVGEVQRATGLDDSERILNCIGAAVPVPDWTAYLDDPASIPSACAGAGTPLRTRAPSATVFASDFGAPKTWRASLGAQRFLTSLLRLSVDANYARGVSQYGVRDLNLDTSGGFTMASEAGRPVYVGASTIVPATGAVSFIESRLDTTFGQVRALGSDLQSETLQFTVSLGGVTRTGVVLQTAYTWSRVRDQSSQSGRGGGFNSLGGNTTAGDPNVMTWARSGFERRHSLLATVSYPFGTSLDVTGIARLSSGTPFTPLVGNDINGDGSANDQAFVFDPVAAPAMGTLLNGTPGAVRRCLEQQVGQIALRNSCTGPWQGSFDVQINYRPSFLGLNRRVSISLTTVNLLHGIDELLHASDNLKGWGVGSRPDATLLYVTGFDPVAQTFDYRVNERFGVSNPGAIAVRQPFQIGIQVRATFGPDRGRAALDALRGGGGRGLGGGGGLGGARPGGAFGGGPGGRLGAGGGFTPDNFVQRFRELLVNPARAVLDLADSLALSAEQVASLTALSDSLAALTDSIAQALQTGLDEAGTQGDPRALLQLIRPRLQQAQEHARASVGAVRALLGDDQWNAVPDRIKNLGQGPQRRQP